MKKNNIKMSYVLREPNIIGGYWSRDSISIVRAARLIKARGLRSTSRLCVYLVLGDDEAYLDQWGSICYLPSSSLVFVGTFTLGSILRSDPLNYNGVPSKPIDDLPETVVE